MLVFYGYGEFVGSANLNESINNNDLAILLDCLRMIQNS
jgi:hypothetical protein